MAVASLPSSQVKPSASSQELGADAQLITCRECAQQFPPEQMTKATRSLRPTTLCRACRAEQRKRSERPNGPQAVNHLIALHVPDPAPAVRVREELQRARERGWPWSSAWPAAVSAATRNLSAREATSWRRALAATRPAWQAAYTGEGTATRLFLPDDGLRHPGEAA